MLLICRLACLCYSIRYCGRPALRMHAKGFLLLDQNGPRRSPPQSAQQSVNLPLVVFQCLFRASLNPTCVRSGRPRSFTLAANGPEERVTQLPTKQPDRHRSGRSKAVLAEIRLPSCSSKELETKGALRISVLVSVGRREDCRDIGRLRWATKSWQAVSGDEVALRFSDSMGTVSIE